MKKIGRLIFAAFLLLVAICLAAIYIFRLQFLPVEKNDAGLDYVGETRIEIPYGITVAETAKILKANNLIKSEKAFYYSARFPFILKFFFPNREIKPFALKSGSYKISPLMDVIEIQEVLSSAQTEFIIVSIPEGYTIKKIASLLEQNEICTSIDFINTCHDSSIPEAYGIPAETIEGYLFPDTYYFNKGMTARTIAEMMVDNFFEKIKSVENLSDKNPEDLYEVVKLASIVEREYRVAEEAPLIASVFKNRLTHSIGLYSCATVEYILTEIQDKPHPNIIKIEDTRIDNPYNTYLYAGLPPGPISNPGLIALDAATNTPKTSYYFFQVADAEAGKHVFNSTFEEHKINHNLYTKN